MTTVIDMLCAAWRAASDGAYLGWNEFTEGGIKDRERKQMLAVIDALADGVSDEMVHAFRRIEHEHCCLGAALNDVATRPVDNQERRALSAAIRAALMLRREGDRHD